MSETDPEEKNRDSFLEGREITQGQWRNPQRKGNEKMQKSRQ
jgi:hypothetical protein